MQNKLQNPTNYKRLINDKELADSLAISLSTILGSSVVKKSDFDKLNQEKEHLLRKTKNLELLKRKTIALQCKLNAFVNYHGQWKPTTRNFEKRMQKLKAEKLLIDFENYPSEISQNLKEAYNCHLNGLGIASYIMILRTIELSVSIIYDNFNEAQYDKNNKPIFISATNKLNWVKSKKWIGGTDFRIAKSFIESRNEAVHEIFIPSELQILSAFQSVIKFLELMKEKLNSNS